MPVNPAGSLSLAPPAGPTGRRARRAPAAGPAATAPRTRARRPGPGSPRDTAPATGGARRSPVPSRRCRSQARSRPSTRRRQRHRPALRPRSRAPVDARNRLQTRKGAVVAHGHRTQIGHPDVQDMRHVAAAGPDGAVTGRAAAGAEHLAGLLLIGPRRRSGAKRRERQTKDMAYPLRRPPAGTRVEDHRPHHRDPTLTRSRRRRTGTDHLSLHRICRDGASGLSRVAA
jgi:hypothetical protein